MKSNFEVKRGLRMRSIPVVLAALFGMGAMYKKLKASMRREREANERNETFLTNLPIIMNVWDSSIRMVSTSRQAIEFFELDSEAQYIERFSELSPQRQPCGTPSDEKAYAFVKKAFAEGYARFEWMHQTLYGKLMPTEIILIRFSRGGENFVAAYTFSLSSVKNAEAFSRELLDNAPLFMEIWDADGNLIDCNRKLFDAFGLKDKEEFSNRFSEFTMPYQHCGTLSNEKKSKLLNKALQGGIVIDEWVYTLLNGEELPLEMTCVRILHEGKPMVLAYGHDLRPIRTAMKREQELATKLHQKDVDERTRIMFDAAPIMITYWDENFNLIDCNKTTLEHYGASEKDEFKRSWRSRLQEFQPNSESLWEILRTNLSNIFANGSTHFEFSEVIGGKIVYYEVEGIRMEYEDNDIVAVTYARDITKLRENEYALKRANEEIKYREKLLSTVNKAATMLLMHDDLEGFSEALKHIIEMIGLFLYADRVQLWRSESVDENFKFYIVEQWQSNIGKQTEHCNEEFSICLTGIADLKNMLLHGKIFNGSVDELPIEFRELLIGHDSTKFLVIIPVFLQNRLWGLLVIDDYVNIRNLSNDELDIIHSASLMIASSYSRIELRNERQRIEIAEESSREKSRFLARMSHEIRTPITAVLGISEIQLQSKIARDSHDEAFSKIYDSAKILLDLVNDILDISKIESGKMHLVIDKYEVASFISDVVNMHALSMTNEEIDFQVFVDTNMPRILVGDNLRIKQIISNILSNAFKYTERGHVKLSFRCKSGEADSEVVELVISISDTGLGMTKEQIDELFNEYTRFHEELAIPRSGAGLGMPIVYNLASLMEANVKVDSKVGEGTVVTIEIPQRKIGSEVLGEEIAERIQRFERETFVERPKFTPESMPYGKVLVVDDVSTNLYVAKGLLELYDLDVEVCDSGRKAIEKIEQGNVYDIIFMDQMMPEINGIEALLEIRNMGYNKTVIALTANAIMGQEEEFLKIGFDDFVSKPIQTVRLNDVLIKHIKDKR